MSNQTGAAHACSTGAPKRSTRIDRLNSRKIHSCSPPTVSEGTQEYLSEPDGKFSQHARSTRQTCVLGGILLATHRALAAGATPRAALAIRHTIAVSSSCMHASQSTIYHVVTAMTHKTPARNLCSRMNLWLHRLQRKQCTGCSVGEQQHDKRALCTH